MKRCPNCNQTYTHDLSFCLADGTGLVPLYDDAEEQTVVRSPAAAASDASGGSAFKIVALVLGVFLFFAVMGLAGLVWYLMNSGQPPVTGNSSQNSNLAPAASPPPTIQKSNTAELDLKQKEDELERERRRLADERKKLDADKRKDAEKANNTDAATQTFIDPGTARIAFSRGSTGQTVTGTAGRSRSYVLRTLAGQYLSAAVSSDRGCVAFPGGATTMSTNTAAGDTFLSLRNNCSAPSEFTLRVHVR